MRHGEFVTSDTHFGHRAMMKPDYAARPFDTKDEMDEEMIRRWNAKVPEGAMVYHLGDFSFRDRKRTERILDQLNGKICLIRGNHDGSIRGGLADRFEWVRNYYETKTADGRKVVMFHYPLVVWNKAHYGAWHLHGHCHGSLKGPKTTRLDVGVDCHDLAPLSFEEVSAIMVTRSYISVDHHRPRER